MKTCFHCHRTLDVSEFYKHDKMRDGLLGKCKDCTKRHSAERIARVKLDPKWLANERSRCRVKQENYRKLGLAKLGPADSSKMWAIRNPAKRKAHNAAARAVRRGLLTPPSNCEDCGKDDRLHKHHWDYSKPLSVEWLCPKCHGARHRIDKL